MGRVGLGRASIWKTTKTLVSFQWRKFFGMGWPIAIERLDCRLTRDELAQSVNQDVMLSGFVTSLLGRQNRSSPCRRGGFS